MQGANQPRQNFISWDQYFMGIAFLARQRSKDPDCQVGACVIKEDKKIAGVGYNGMPTGCGELRWAKCTDKPLLDVPYLDNKKYYVCHAESNAIMFRNTADLKGCTIFTTLFPCNQCVTAIIQSGITKVIYFSEKEQREEDENRSQEREAEYEAAKIMFTEANVIFEKYDGSCQAIEVTFSTENLPA